MDEAEELRNQYWLDQLAEQKITWENLLEKGPDPLTMSRLSTKDHGRTLLHLAVLDNRLDVVETLSKEPALQLKRDVYGLSAVEIGQFLDRKECLQLLRIPAEAGQRPSLPEGIPFTYLDYPVFETKETFDQVLKLVAKAKREDKIPAEKIWMGVYFDKELRKGVHPSVSIRQVDEEVGHGVFAEKKIPACTYVGEYTGIIQERPPKKLKDKRYCLRCTIWEGKKNFAIDAENRGNFTRFLNHSVRPNLCLQSIYWRGMPRMIFVTLKEIREGGQLTFDYGPLFWKESHQHQKPLDED